MEKIDVNKYPALIIAEKTDNYFYLVKSDEKYVYGFWFRKNSSIIKTQDQGKWEKKQFQNWIKNAQNKDQDFHYMDYNDIPNERKKNMIKSITEYTWT